MDIDTKMDANELPTGRANSGKRQLVRKQKGNSFALRFPGLSDLFFVGIRACCRSLQWKEQPNVQAASRLADHSAKEL